ncbi:rod shape-determining protein, partial [Patescibacteria group bacterium]|nr:rod shape-determining protein [Patescibacteria group bacterium]
MQSFKDLLNVGMGVDVGSSRSRVLCAGRGVVVNEHSYLALSLRTSEVAESGDKAYNLFGRSPAHIAVKRPVRQGVIEDFDTADQMLRSFFERAQPRKPLFGSWVIVVVPTGATDVEKKAFEDLCIQAGAREVRLVEACMASIIGMGLPLQQSRGMVVVNLGGGTTQFALVSEGELLYSGCERVGGEDLNEAIAAGIKKKHGIALGYRTLEKLKVELGNVYPMEQEETQEVY